MSGLASLQKRHQSTCTNKREGRACLRLWTLLAKEGGRGWICTIYITGKILFETVKARERVAGADKKKQMHHCRQEDKKEHMRKSRPRIPLPPSGDTDDSLLFPDEDSDVDPDYSPSEDEEESEEESDTDLESEEEEDM